jgi:transcriptional regulator with XRE-family HTH domain
MKLSTLVRAARTKLGVNLRDLAGNVGVSASFLSRIERGEHVRISDRRLVRLAAALNLQVDDVYRCAGRLPPDIAKYVLENMGVVRKTMVRRSRSTSRAMAAVRAA